jgi:hypothetical protein
MVGEGAGRGPAAGVDAGAEGWAELRAEGFVAIGAPHSAQKILVAATALPQFGQLAV